MDNTKSINHICQRCSIIFTQRWNLLRHIRTVHTTSKEFICHECDYKTSRKDHLKQHQNRKDHNIHPCELNNVESKNLQVV